MLSKKFTQALKLSNIRQYELARQAGIDHSQLSQMVNGIVAVKRGDSRLLKAGEILGLNPKEVFLEIDDPFLLPVWQIKIFPGMMPEDKSPGGRKPFARSRDSLFKTEQRIYDRDADFLLCQGSPAGICDDGLVWHLGLGSSGQRFIGFILKNLNPGRVAVVTRGAYMVLIRGVKPSDEGKAVFARALNEFSLEKGKGFHEIGVVRFVQPDKADHASVAFGRQDSKY